MSFVIANAEIVYVIVPLDPANTPVPPLTVAVLVRVSALVVPAPDAESVSPSLKVIVRAALGAAPAEPMITMVAAPKGDMLPDPFSVKD